MGRGGKMEVDNGRAEEDEKIEDERRMGEKEWK